MSCKKIQELLAQEIISPLEKETIEQHLSLCQGCAESVRQDTLLSKLFTEAVPQETDIIPIAFMKTRVETALNARSARFSLKGLLRKPMLFPVTALLLLVVVFSLMNRKEHQLTLTDNAGYKVALAGISPELAGDDEIICDMLFDVGLHEASVDIVGCEATCNLVIFDLKSKKEADMVVEIFHAINKQKIKTDVIKIPPQSI